MNKLFPTIELLGSMADSEETILNKASEHNISVVVAKNSSDEVSIALPYYSAITKAPFTEVEDDDLEEVSGGEFIGIIAITIGLGSVAAAGLAAGAITIGVDESKKADERRAKGEK